MKIGLTETERRTFKRMIDSITQSGIEEKMKKGIAPDLKWMNSIDFQWREKEETKPEPTPEPTKREILLAKIRTLFGFKKKLEPMAEHEPKVEESIWGENVISFEELRKNKDKNMLT